MRSSTATVRPTEVGLAPCAKAGHPAPFNLKYLEIGNENGGPTYREHYPCSTTPSRPSYPELQSRRPMDGTTGSAPAEIVDEHYYNSPEFFFAQCRQVRQLRPHGSTRFMWASTP